MVAETQRPVSDQEWLDLAKLELVHPAITDEGWADFEGFMRSSQAPPDLGPLSGEYFLG